MNTNAKKYYLTLDIGGTTFTVGLFNNKLEQVLISKESHINDYLDKISLINGIFNKIKKLLDHKNILLDEVYALGIAAPGPLNSVQGKILDTPNLTILKNTYLTKELESLLSIPAKLENDANLFALGDWYLKHRIKRVLVGVTLGSGLGFGIIIDNKLFTGANGMAAEYGISPYGENIWEDKISIEGINNLSNQLYDKIYSPKEIFMLASNKDKKALNIWDNFGYNLGLALSHVVNLIDPEVISIGGGLSNAFKYFNKKMVATLKNFSPSFNHNKIVLMQSKNYLNSIHQGAVLLFNEENKFIKS